MKLVSSLLLALLTVLPAFSQQSTREDFKEYCQAMVGRWVGDVTWVADWPGVGKRGDKVTGYSDVTLLLDGHALVGRFYGGAASSAWITYYDAGAKQIRSSGSDSGGNTWSAIVAKKDGKWVSAESGSLPDGAKYEGKYTVTISENGNKHTWTGPTTMAGKKTEEMNDVFRRVSK